MIRKIAITGASGHIGANMVRALLKQGFEARALYHTSGKTQALEELPVERRAVDVLDINTLREAFRGVDAVIHLAAIISVNGDPDGRVMRTNTEGPRNVVQACLDCSVRKLIHFSSIHAFRYTAADPIVTEAHPPAGPGNFAYDRSKAAGEREVLEGVSRGLDAVILNPTGVIGPYDFGSSHSGQMLKSLMKGTLPALAKGGFDWVDARDIADAAVAALQKGRAGERYILSGQWASLRELATLCHRYSGRRPPLLELPLWTALLGLPFLKAFGRITGSLPLYTYESITVLKHSNRNCSNEKARRELGYKPRPLEETIRDIYDWYKVRGMV
ncbi:MAG: NAD-dependent epimerase/dehydratase family protein [Phaeodactylibacter sp.]|nr:NAD-dependent epimerase/dehydratase family protein [Phaeodactylibacter sp.]MCB9275465.1 NAD-dependent epimerase/dehydratase family protein [Lewinellaceae bacterium]